MCTKDAANLLVDTCFTHSLQDASEPESEPVKLFPALSSFGGNDYDRLPGPRFLSVGEVFRAFHSCHPERYWNIPRSVCDIPKDLQYPSTPRDYHAPDFPHVDSSLCGKKLSKHISLNKKPRNNQGRDLINSLPEELLCHIFVFLPTTYDRASCASVCRRWLMLQSHMHYKEYCSTARGCVEVSKHSIRSCDRGGTGVGEDKSLDFGTGSLSRTLVGKKASDVRLAAIAVGTSACGGLGKLCIRGNYALSLTVGVTDVGISAIGISCSSLRVLSLWGCPYVTNEGLSAIGKGCPLLEKLSLFKCPLLGDSGARAIANNCPRISFLSLDECINIGNASLIAFGDSCPLIISLNIRNCPSINDDGLVTVFSKLIRLRMLKLESLKVTQKTLSSIGMNLRVLTWLSLRSLNSVTAEGFMSFGMETPMQSLKRILITSCKHFTDEALCLLGRKCLNLKNISLFKCDRITDEGLMHFMQNAFMLEVLQIEKCRFISGMGLVASISNKGGKLKEIQVKKCGGMNEVQLFHLSRISHGSAVESICVANCPGVGDVCLALLGWLCPHTTKVDFTGLTDITDEGMLAFLSAANHKLTSVNISGCVHLTDRAVCAIVSQCGSSLRSLILDGCKKVSDKALTTIASHCQCLEDLGLSMCTITDEGVKQLVEATGNTFSSLSLCGCCDVTHKLLPLIQKKCKNLLDLNLRNCGGMAESFLMGFKSRMQKCAILY